MSNRIERPTLDATGLETWLGLLADRELPVEAKQELVHYLDQHPAHWRDCAVMLWDESSLRDAYVESKLETQSAAEAQVGSRELIKLTPYSLAMQIGRNGSAIAPIATKTLNKRDRSHRFWLKPVASWCAAAATLLIVFAGGWLSGGKFDDRVAVKTQHNELLAEIGELKTLTSNLAAGWAAEQSTLRTVADMFPDAPMLLEVESTPWRTVYLTDRPASDQMISTLASMSEKVTVEPYEPEIVTPLWRSLNRPVVAIEVTRNDFPLLTGVQR